MRHAGGIVIKVIFTTFRDGGEQNVARLLPVVPRVGEHVALSHDLPTMDVVSVLWDLVKDDAPSVGVTLR